MVHRVRWMAGAAALVAMVMAATVAATVVTLTTSKDNTLYEDDFGSLSNGWGEHIFAGRTASGARRRAVIHFDLSGIPAGSTINSVTLRLRVTRSHQGSDTMSVYRLLRDWGEGDSHAEGGIPTQTNGQTGGQGSGDSSHANDATWIHTFFDAALWETPGGDFAAVASASASQSGTIGNFNQWSTTGLKADVQAWVNSPPSNFGWIVRGVETTSGKTHRYASKDYPDATWRPQLIVDYTPPPPPCLADIVGPAGVAPRDGHVGGEDFLAFVGAFFGGGLLADVVGPSGSPPPDGHLGGEDFLMFVATFFGGC